MSWKARVPLLAAAFWWGALSGIGLIAVPLLFAHAPSPVVAGRLAAKLFQALTWVTLICGVLLLASARTEEDPPRMDWAGGATGLVVAGMLLALLVEFAVAPRILARQDLRFWHTLGSAMMAGQWLCAFAVLWKVAWRDRAAATGVTPPAS